MLKYLNENSADLTTYCLQQLQLVLTALGLALILAVVIIMLFMSFKKLMQGLVYFFSALYAVPSYAFFAILIPLTGLGVKTAVIVLTLYSEYILLRTFLTGLAEIDPGLLEAAAALGMTKKQIFFKVQLPLVIPSIFSGLKVALASVMGSATIAATISAGGLGQVLFLGLQTQDLTTILVGTLLTMVLTLMIMAVMQGLEYLLSKKAGIR